MLTVDGIHFKDLVNSFMDIPTSKEFFIPGFWNTITWKSRPFLPSSSLKSPVLVSMFINLSLYYFYYFFFIKFSCVIICVPSL